MMPLINIITISFNSEKYLEQTILSVINQDYKNINYIVIDGGSQDSTLEIIKKYRDFINVLVSESDKGIADAFNKGLQYCHEGLVGFLNSDDYFSSNSSISTIANNYVDEQTIICGSLQLITPQMKPIRRLESKPYLLPLGMYVLHPTMYTPVSLSKRIGNFNTDYSIAIDYDWTARCLRREAKFKVLDNSLVFMRIGGSSSDTHKMHKEERMIRDLYFKNKWWNALKYVYDSTGKFYHKLFNLKIKINE